MIYQIVVVAAFGAVLGEVFGTSCQVGQMVWNSCDDQIGVGSIHSNSKSKIINHCSAFSRPEPVSNSTWVDIISIDCEPTSLLLINTTEHYWNETNECHIVSNINPELTLIFVTRVTLDMILVESNETMHNILCNFNVWRHHNCCNLAALTQGRLPVCHHKNYSMSINITFAATGDIYLNDEENQSITTFTTYNCYGYSTTMPTLTNNYDHETTSILTTSYSCNPPSITATPSLSTSSTMSMDITSTTATSPSVSIAGLTVSVVCSILVIGALICISIAVLLIYIWRKYVRQKQSFEDQNNSYSLTQVHHEENHQSQLQANANQYEQFHLSSSTEFIPSAVGEAISSMSTQPELQADFNGIYSSIDTVQPQPVSQDMEGDDPMYDVVGKGSDDKKHKDSHDGPSVVSNYQNITKTKDTTSITEEGSPSTPLHVVDIHWADPKSNATVDDEEASPTPHNRIEELYTVVKKNPKGNEKEEVAPPLPPHTVEELYTAVVKKPKTNAENKEQNPPPDSVEELYTAVVKKPKGNVEDEDKAPPIPPYSVEEHIAVNRNSKDNQGNDSEEVAPPIPPHTVEELYTVVMKKPKDRKTKDGEEAPPIPPYTVDELSCSSDNY